MNTRHPGLARRKDSFVVVIDMQPALWERAWEKERARSGVQLLVQGARMLGLPVIATEQNPARLGRTMPEVAELLDGAPVIEKMAFSCCGEPGFMQALAALGRKTAILCGTETHICVTQTALDLLHAGYRVQVPADAAAGRGEINWRVALEALRAAGVIVTTVEAVLFQLLERADTDEFRALARLIKAHSAG